METEIERKFLVKKLPNLSKIPKQTQERYFLYHDKNVVIRIQKIDKFYEIERKERRTKIKSIIQKFKITKLEYNFLKTKCDSAILRDCYVFSEDPEVSIKIYHGRFEGLIRAEFEFHSSDVAKKFIPPNWVGKEITDLSIGNDSRLIDLTDEELGKIFNK